MYTVRRCQQSSEVYKQYWNISISPLHTLITRRFSVQIIALLHIIIIINNHDKHEKKWSNIIISVQKNILGETTTMVSLKIPAVGVL